tara:strand:- start:151 stop:546 length:396 start_codon:yes stop_codon:yes gene_type:complete
MNVAKVSDGISALEEAIASLLDSDVLTQSPFDYLTPDDWQKVFSFYRDADIITQVEALVLMMDHEPKYAAWKMALGCPVEYLHSVDGRRQLQQDISLRYETTTLHSPDGNMVHDIRRIPDEELKSYLRKSA